MYRPFVFAGALLFIALPGTHADEPLSLAAAIRQALAHNRELAAATLGPEAARGRVDQAILKPNPSLEAGAGSDLITGNTGAKKFTFGVTQAIPLGNRLREAQGVARVDVALASLAIADRQRVLIGEVTRSFVDLLAQDREIALRDRLIEISRRLVDLARARAKLGEVSTIEVNAAALELAKLEPERAALLAERTSELQRLKPLLGLAPEAELEITGQLDALVPTLAASADGDKTTWNRPDLRAAAVAIDRVEAEQRLARAEVRGDLIVGADYDFERGPKDPEDHSHQLGVSVSIPLPVRNKNQGRLRELRAERTRAQRELEAQELAAASEVAVARQRVAQFQKIVEGYRASLLPLGETAERDLVAAYQQGQVPLFQVIQSQQQRLALEAGAVEAGAAYARALADLQTATGRNPQLESVPALEKQP